MFLHGNGQDGSYFQSHSAFFLNHYRTIAVDTGDIANHLPNAPLSIIKGNHFIANKEFVTFNQVVEKFLANVIV